MKEIWKDIVGFEGLYQISNLGMVKSVERYVDRNGRPMRVRERILKPSVANNGYLIVNLNNQGFTTKYIHRLVAEHFIENPNPEVFTCVEHINACKMDNVLENLRWCSYIMNNNNPITRQRMSDGSKGHAPSPLARQRLIEQNSKSVCQLSLSGELVKVWPSPQSVSRELGVCVQTIYRCCNHPDRGKTAGGYKWRYYEKREH